MNILVTGANGQLGNEMRIISKQTNDNYTFTDVVEVEGVETTLLDITDADAIRKIVKEKDIPFAASSTPKRRNSWPRR